VNLLPLRSRRGSFLRPTPNGNNSWRDMGVTVQVCNAVGVMPPFGETMTPAQIEDVARYVYEATRRD
jgi:mono/diheme cytochrome c family protein